MAKTEAETETVPAPEQKTVPTWTVADGLCPFRRYGDTYLLDDRCPESVRCVVVPGASVRTESGPSFVPVSTVPIAEGYCGDECLKKQIREKERGLDVRERRANSGSGGGGGKMRSVGRRQMPRKQTLKEESHRLARQMMEGKRAGGVKE